MHLNIGEFSTRGAHVFSQSAVRSAQQQLKNDGYYHGHVDGVDGPMMRAAIRKYQSANNLAVNGGSTGRLAEAWVYLQQQGLYSGNIDGQIGPQTVSAILDSATLNSLGVSE